MSVSGGAGPFGLDTLDSTIAAAWRESEERNYPASSPYASQLGGSCYGSIPRAQGTAGDRTRILPQCWKTLYHLLDLYALVPETKTLQPVRQKPLSLSAPPGEHPMTTPVLTVADEAGNGVTLRGHKKGGTSGHRRTASRIFARRSGNVTASGGAVDVADSAHRHVSVTQEVDSPVTTRDATAAAGAKEEHGRNKPVTGAEDSKAPHSGTGAMTSSLHAGDVTFAVDHLNKESGHQEKLRVMIFGVARVQRVRLLATLS
ncbi:unnamed protein product, partial [Cyprideis torosa]